MDLDQIRIKLSTQTNHPNRQVADSFVDWPRASISRQVSRNGVKPNRSSDPTKLANAVATLKQRATHTEGGQYPAQPPAPTTVNSELEEAAVQEASMHFKRLSALADKINLLSSEQEHLLGEIKIVQGRLKLLQPYLQTSGNSAGLLPNVVLEGAVLASAESDGEANLVVTYRSAVIPHPEQDARDVAEHLRGTYGAGSLGQRLSWAEVFSDFGMILQEPAAVLDALWNKICDLKDQLIAQPVGQAPKRRPRQSLIETAESFSLMDMLLWFGGGVIGRLALNLVLSAFPVLWSLAVAILTAITAYALYRATLAPRRDFALAYRVFLAIAGLVVGGRL